MIFPLQSRTTVVAVLLALFGAAPASPQVPSPADVFGFVPGTDYRLADYDMIVRYFDALDRASDRVVVERIGESSLGKPLLLALISSPANLERRARYRAISERLALAQIPDDEARALAAEGRVVVWVDGGLHATEVAHGQFTPAFAHWLATDEGEEARRVREQAIVLLMPNMNPDGLDIVVRWYNRNVGTPYETSDVPELYHHYIGHDNNRDWYMFTQVETRAVAEQLYHVWFPQIVYNHHQSGPFPGRIWVPPFENPVNPNLDPLVVTSINQIGESMKKRFALEGKPGVVSGVVYDMWWNGSMRGAPDFHNMLGFLTETALYRYATPHCYEASEIPSRFNARAGNLPADRPTTNYPDPWRGGCWHLRDPIEYMMTATRAVVDVASRLREDYLYNIYRMGRRQIERGRRAVGGPFAYVIDVEAQHDPSAAVAMLRVFRRGGIEIRRADGPLEAGGRTYAAGTYVIPPQAFRPFVVDLIEPKTYPDRRQYPGGPPEPPYDMTGYELSLQMGVAVDRIAEPFDVPEAVADTIPAARGGLPGGGAACCHALLGPTANASAAVVNEALAAGVRVARAAAPFAAAGATWPAGTYVLEFGGTDDAEAVQRAGVKHGVAIRPLADAPSVATRPLAAPRIGLYESYVANMPGGWTRWLFDQYGFGYDRLENDDIRRGDLSAYDVIILPDQRAESIRDGHAPGDMPEEYTGGLGRDGAAALRQFVEAGGWLVAVDQAADYAIAEFDLPVRNVVGALASDDFFIPGSLISIRLADDPVTRGMPEAGIAFFVRSQAFEVVEGAAAERVTVFARYGDDPLASGWAHGADAHLAGRVAGARASVGNGQVVLFGFEPHFRGQPHNTFKLLFNALYGAAEER